MPRTLSDIEQVVAEVEQAKSLEASADRLRRDDDITLPSAIRWARRRARLVQALLTTLVALPPELFLGCTPTVYAFRTRLGRDGGLSRVFLCLCHFGLGTVRSKKKNIYFKILWQPIRLHQNIPGHHSRLAEQSATGGV